MRMVIDIPDEIYAKLEDDVSLSLLSREQLYVLQNHILKGTVLQKGEWIVDKEMSMLFAVYRCSNCHNIGSLSYKYCQNCGAEMEVNNADSD